MDAIYILWLRQMKRYFRTKSRIAGSIGQPILFLLALGYGVGSVYKAAGQGNYLEFLVPGVILQTILFSGVFWGAQIIFDKRFGFMKELLVAPVARLQILLGNSIGGATTSFIQAIMVLVASIIFGFRFYNLWYLPITLLIIIILSIALTNFGAGIGSMVEDFQGFQSINSFLVFPLFFLSSALYPLNNVPAALKFLASINPLSYAVDLLRYTMINTHHFNLALDTVVLLATFVLTTIFAVNRFNRIEV